MKCPICKRKLTVEKTSNKNINAELRYDCSNCNKVFVHKFGLLFFMIFFLIGAPLIEMIVRLVTESFLYVYIGDVIVYGWELSRIISVIITFFIIVGIFFKLNILVEADGDKPEQ